MFDLFKLFFVAMVILLISSCRSEIDNVYYPGVIEIKANRDFPNGMIKALDAFYDDSELESLNRAIIYTYDKNEVFDLGDTVLYKIKKPWFSDNLLLATGIEKNDYYIGRLANSGNTNFVDPVKLYGDSLKKKVNFGSALSSPRVGLYLYQINEDGDAIDCVEYDEAKYASLDQLYAMKRHYMINLHQADPHREGPFHVRRHVRPPKKLLYTSNTGDEVFKAVIMVDDNGNESGYIINDPYDVPDGPDYEYYLYYKDPLPQSSQMITEIESFFSKYNVRLESQNIYDISTSHDHTHN